MRRGQIEFIGLAFVVVLLVIGFAVYVRFSTVDSSSVRAAGALQGATSLLVSVKETDIPSCGTSLERVIAACVEGKPLCGDSCVIAQRSLETIAGTALTDRGVNFNLSVEGTDLMVVHECESANPAIDIAAAPPVPIVLSHGGGSRNLILAICQ